MHSVGADVELVAKTLRDILNPSKRADQVVRIEAGKHRQHLEHLRHLPHLFDIAEPIILDLSLEICRGYEMHPQKTFYDLFKEPSFDGYDVFKNRLIDYGNVVYKAFLIMCATWSGPVRDSLERCFQYVPTLQPGRPDTYVSLSNMGDFVEVIYAITRSHDHFGCRRHHDVDTWRTSYAQFCQAFHALDYLRALLFGRKTKRYPEERVRKAKLGIELADSALLLALVARAYLELQ